MFKKLFGRREAPTPPAPKPLINLEDARARHFDPEVPSPCISVCELDEQLGRCKGCYRTLQEIAAWSRMSEEDKLAAWERIEARQTPHVVR